LVFLYSIGLDKQDDSLYPYKRTLEYKEGVMGELRAVNFYDDTIYLVDFEGEPYVPVKPISDNLFPLAVLADALRVHPYEIVKRLKDEDLFRDEKLAEAVARMHGPEFGLPLFVRDSGLRRLFADVDRDEIEAEVLDKVLRAFERLEARSLSLKVALKIIAAREAGYTYEEIACALGLSDDKVRRLERDLRSINFWKMAKEKLLPRKMLASPAV